MWEKFVYCPVCKEKYENDGDLFQICPKCGNKFRLDDVETVTEDL